MSQRLRIWLAVLSATVLVAAPGKVMAGASTSDSLVELAARGGPSASLGFGVSPLHWELIAPLQPMPGLTPTDSRLQADRGRAVSVDLKLKWPTGDLAIEPYLVLGPALLLEQPQDPPSLLGAPADPVLRLGAKAGAGFNWRLSKDATLFGSYDVTTSAVDALMSPRVRSAPTGASTEYDLLYGVRFRY